jgi:hypothetical protein
MKPFIGGDGIHVPWDALCPWHPAPLRRLPNYNIMPQIYAIVKKEAARSLRRDTLIQLGGRIFVYILKGGVEAVEHSATQRHL